MTGIVTGIAVGVAMILINGIIGAAAGMRKRGRQETQTARDNALRIAALEQRANETKELVKLTLSTCIIIGDGMVQNGINGEFKKAFCDKKQDALKML
ncbi:MAG: hypothetical protein ACOX8Q_06355 [Christensenellales bacterium]|jgi:hypothetical protein